MEMNDSALTIDQLDALSRAVPDDQERKDVRLYLQVYIWPSNPLLGLPCCCRPATWRAAQSRTFSSTRDTVCCSEDTLDRQTG